MATTRQRHPPKQARTPLADEVIRRRKPLWSRTAVGAAEHLLRHQEGDHSRNGEGLDVSATSRRGHDHEDQSVTLDTK